MIFNKILIDLLSIGFIYLVIGTIIGALYVAKKPVPPSVKAQFIGQTATHWPVVLLSDLGMFLVDIINGRKKEDD